MFLHSLSSFFHILFNMLALWMFGRGDRTNVGNQTLRPLLLRLRVSAPAFAWCWSTWRSAIPISTFIGASGAIYGILLAFGHCCFPDQTVLMSFLFPIKGQVHGHDLWRNRVPEFVPDRKARSAIWPHLGGNAFSATCTSARSSARGLPAFRPSISPAAGRNSNCRRAKKEVFRFYMKKQDSGRGTPGSIKPIGLSL